MKEKEILLEFYRYSSNSDSSLGVVLFRGNFECDLLEDEYRAKKVAKETRILSGVHRLRIREAETGLTKKYRERYPWFEYHIEILTPTHQYTYIHNGTNDDHTDGCPLVGEKERNNVFESGRLKASKKDEVFKRFYQKVYPILKKGEKDYFVRIVDLDTPVTL